MSETRTTRSVHWADINADKIVRERGEKAVYTCASGVTPSGTVHIGNFREIISVDLVARALRDKGKPVRFIFSWDDYDVFRKVPKNMPEPDLLETYLRKPITLVPDTTGEYESYAMRNEKAVEQLLPIVGIRPEYLYQASKYRASEYAAQIRIALERRDELRAVLDEFRTSPLPEDWWPISVFSTFTGFDTTTVLGWDGAWTITYRCDETGKTEELDLRTTAAVKLPWRIDWPMRWAYEQVDFEPAGKDHHSEGGSFDTSRKVVRIFDAEPPVTFQYDFIRIKGRGGKISSSSGEVISLTDVLEVYTPEIVRYLFVGTRPNTEFAISFDLDVLKIYEDYDKCERIYYGKQEIQEKKREMELRTYELSQVDEVPKEMPYQMSIRHLCNLLQVHDGDIDAAVATIPDINPGQIDRFKVRCRCALNWVREYAPEDFRFSLVRPEDGTIELAPEELACVQDLVPVVRDLSRYDEKALAERIYEIAHARACEPAALFKAAYQVLIRKEKGPRLAGFVLTCGTEKVLPILEAYLG